MTSPAGWYPDPGGQPGLFRFWDGQAWSSSTSSAPQAPPPDGHATGRPAAGKKPPLGWILGGAGVVVVLIIVVIVIVRLLSPGSQYNAPTPDNSPSSPAVSGSPAESDCPEATQEGTSPAPGGARVTSGHLSYPRLGPPFGPPTFDDRVPYGHDIRSQVAPLEYSATGQDIWAADVLIARLLAGDGFFGPEQGSKIMVSCVIGKFYGDNQVDRHDLKNQATTVDGHPAWLVESKLSYDIPGVKAKSELMIVLVINTAPGEGGLFYASLPDTAPKLQAEAVQALAGLRVS